MNLLKLIEEYYYTFVCNNNLKGAREHFEGLGVPPDVIAAILALGTESFFIDAEGDFSRIFYKDEVPLKEHDVVRVKTTGALGTIVYIYNGKYAVELTLGNCVEDFSARELERAE